MRSSHHHHHHHHHRRPLPFTRVRLALYASTGEPLQLARRLKSSLVLQKKKKKSPEKMSSVRTAHHHHHHHPRIPNDLRLCFGSSPTCKAQVISCRWSDFIWRENRREVNYWATGRRVSDSIRLAIGLGTKSHGEKIHVVPPPPLPHPLTPALSGFLFHVSARHIFSSRLRLHNPDPSFPEPLPSRIITHLVGLERIAKHWRSGAAVHINAYVSFP